MVNGRFTMLDMTDYDYNFSGPDEIGGQLPIANWGLLQPLIKEPWTQTNSLVEVNYLENQPVNSTSKTHKEL